MNAARPGWYEDPKDPNTLRWWSGTEWSEHSHPQRLETPRCPNEQGGDDQGEMVEVPRVRESSPGHPRWLTALAGAVLIALAAWLVYLLLAQVQGLAF